MNSPAIQPMTNPRLPVALEINLEYSVTGKCYLLKLLSFKLMYYHRGLWSRVQSSLSSMPTWKLTSEKHLENTEKELLDKRKFVLSNLDKCNKFNVGGIVHM